MQNFHRMFGGEGDTQTLGFGGDLHGAADVAHHHNRRAAFLDVTDLAFS